MLSFACVRFLLFSCLSFISVLTATSASSSGSGKSSIYDVLHDHGLPEGVLPKGVKEFGIDGEGRFWVHLDQACNAQFENELHFERNVSGTLSYGQIGALSGISAQDLFLWFPVKGIRVDVPNSGLIYFDVGVVRKQFSMSLFETPRDCVAVRNEDVVGFQDGRFMAEAVSKEKPENIARNVL
ncbi:uncharacterized protein LOC114712305 isoform X2 [Neltuma alba]|uniref:uncharacterized protein LOC114712305 isoform X2 n=1 Tax=Neltuma alba TaxID=207710 RepID=UPI0010A41060|nr:uncharacterized protein LOC114712305 isoform X2 [Prosopis alba]